MFKLFNFALLLTVASAFTSPAFVRPRLTTARPMILSDAETEEILQSAQDCMASECSIDDVDMLLGELKQTEDELQGRLDKVMNAIAALQHANSKDDRDQDEVRAFVSDLLSVFGQNGNTGHFPIGFSGDIGNGPTTAYDALPPKKWKPSA